MQQESPLPAHAFKARVLFFIALFPLAVAIVFWRWPEPYAQPLEYHRFADQRTLLGIPHCLNVLSNVPFIVVGLLGLWFVWSNQAIGPASAFHQAGERRPYVLLFAGVLLTAFGSAYYHLHPTNDRLAWDRLPMTVAFMSLFAAVIGERIHQRWGAALLWPLVAVGAGSVVYWHMGEVHGRGDLRLYGLVQFYPLLVIPLMLLLFPPRYTRTGDLFSALGWYAGAKVLELPAVDRGLFAVGQVVSGHTLKHLAAALGAYWLLRMLQRRRSIAQMHAGHA